MSWTLRSTEIHIFKNKNTSWNGIKSNIEIKEYKQFEKPMTQRIWTELLRMFVSIFSIVSFLSLSVLSNAIVRLSYEINPSSNMFLICF